MNKFVILLIGFVLLCDFTQGIYDDEYLADSDLVLDRQKRDILPSDAPLLKISLRKVEPYMFYNNSKSGNGRYSGFIPDIIEKLAQTAVFKYEFNKDEVSLEEFARSSEYDMIAAPITITKANMAKVDFIHPFDHVEFRVIIQQPRIQEQNLKKLHHKAGKHRWDYAFNVFKPFAPETWATATIFIILVWLFMWIMNKYNPYEHGYRYNNGRGAEDESTLFNISGSFWFVFSTLQWQGYDRRPLSLANRVISCFWMCFVTLTLVSYIASAVNHLFWADAVRRQTHSAQQPLNDLLDVIEHKHGYEYGVVKGSVAYKLITDPSSGPRFVKMKTYLESRDGLKNTPNSIEEGFLMARKGKYAFIVEDTTAKYELSKEPCDLVDTGIKFGMNSYGFAIKKGFKSELSQAMLGLIETGFLEALDEQWFAPDELCIINDALARDERDYHVWRLHNPGRITMHEYWSVLVLLIVGICVSTIVAVIEAFWFRYKGRYRSRYEYRGGDSTIADQ